jgi:hypothetical protein
MGFPDRYIFPKFPDGKPARDQLRIRDRDGARSGYSRRFGLVSRSRSAHIDSMITARKLLWMYGAVAILTLIFQVWWRSGECQVACASTFAKGLVWAVIWPASWVVFLKGFV